MKNYTAPELLLVGAAQQLVLGDCVESKHAVASAIQVENSPVTEYISCREDLETQNDDFSAF
jgi:hypothetical protein